MSPPDRGQRAGEAISLVVLFACGAALAFYYGHIGFMPLDQSIVFDGGWRVLSGQLPHRDFDTPNGVVPILIQAVFFRALGVTWLAYCAHAAVFNGFFALASYAFLRFLDAPRPLAGLYAALSAVVFYPPFGVPYMDQHAFFFALLALVCAVRAVTRGGRGSLLAWGLVAPFLLLAGLSKQLPSAYALPVLLWVWSAYEPRRWPAARAAVTGGVVAVFAVAALAWLAGVDPAAAFEDLVISPRAAASDRLGGRFLPAIASWNIGRFPSVWGYAACLLVPIASAALCIGALAGGTQRALAGFGFPAGLALGLFAMSFLFAWFTENAPENALAYLFLSLGALHVAVVRFLGGDRAGGTADRRRPFVRWVQVAFVALALLDAVRFDLRVNRTRAVHDIEVATLEPPGGQLPAALSGLRWLTPEHNRSTPNDVARLVHLLERQDAPFFLIGDTSMLYGITGKPSLNPALWFHPNLTLPMPGTPEFAAYEDRLIARLEAHRVRWLVVEGERTWLGVRATHLPRLSELARARASRHVSFGPYRVLELNPPLGLPVADFAD